MKEKPPSTPRRSTPPKRVSGSLMLTPEILEMKKQQEEAKARAERILKLVRGEELPPIAAFVPSK